MIKKTYAILDTASQCFLNPISFQTDGDAIRWFNHQVNSKDAENLISLYPHHYSLYRLMDYNDQLGIYQHRDMQKDDTEAQKNSKSQPKEIITAIALKTEEDHKYTVKELINMLKHEMGQAIVPNTLKN